MAQTPVVRTGRGFHVYLRSKTPLKTQRFDGGEIRGEGVYVVAPPSVHENGHSYQFINPDIVDILTIESLADLGLEPSSDGAAISKDPNWVVQALQGVAEGQRDATCIRLAGHYKAKRLGYEETLIILKTWGAGCNPPFPDKDIQKCVKSAYGYLEREARNQANAMP